jgi:SAM-dependent methyltransferase
MTHELEKNIQAYRTDEAVEKYAYYGLYPNERYLFDKYFQPGSAVLDLACGAGRTTLRLHELGYEVRGYDLSDRLIESAKKRFPALDLRIGNYCEIPEADKSYDNILISHNGLDYAYPESARVQAIKECARVIRRGGYLIMSSHNIKSLHFSPYYLGRRTPWMLRNSLKAFRARAYVFDLGMYTFFCSASYCVGQFSEQGFAIKEIIGFRSSHNKLFNKFISPYIHYVFQRM